MRIQTTKTIRIEVAVAEMNMFTRDKSRNAGMVMYRRMYGMCLGADVKYLGCFRDCEAIV